ncbi:MAG: metalloregulator ArsR/SmtB family transcription factor [Pseudomonadota bacterium]
MDINLAVQALDSLAHDTRLKVFKLLVKNAESGLAAGEIAHELGVRQNTMSANLASLSRVGLVQAERRGRSIVYHANFETMRTLLAFLMDDCCGGRPELCDALIRERVGKLSPDAALTS